MYNTRFLQCVGNVLRGFRAHFLFWAELGEMKHSVDEQIREIAAKVADENNLELVHAETIGTNKNLTVRVFIDKQGGVTHEDCTKVSREMEKILDAEDMIPLSYLLEVSSPGLERGLYNLKDFEKFAGNLAKVKTSQPINGQKNFRGRIIGVENEEVIFDDKTSGTVRFPHGSVAKANLEIDFEEELKRAKS